MRGDRQRTGVLTAGLVGLGVVGVAGGVVATETALLSATLGPVLLSVGAVCLVGGLLAWTLFGEQGIPAATARGVYESLSANQESLLAVFDLSAKPVYVPTGRDPETEPDDAVRVLYLADEVSAPATVDPDVTVLGGGPGQRGVALQPTAGPFLAGLYRDLPAEPSDDIDTLADQLADAAVESLDLAATVRAIADGTTPDAVFEISGQRLGSTARDAPAISFLAAGLAAVLGDPIVLTIDDSDPERTRVSCRRLDVEQMADATSD